MQHRICLVWSRLAALCRRCDYRQVHRTLQHTSQLRGAIVSAKNVENAWSKSIKKSVNFPGNNDGLHLKDARSECQNSQLFDKMLKEETFWSTGLKVLKLRRRVKTAEKEPESSRTIICTSRLHDSVCNPIDCNIQNACKLHTFYLDITSNANSFPFLQEV